MCVCVRERERERTACCYLSEFRNWHMQNTAKPACNVDNFRFSSFCCVTRVGCQLGKEAKCLRVCVCVGLCSCLCVYVSVCVCVYVYVYT